jgi:hypothetical protein
MGQDFPTTEEVDAASDRLRYEVERLISKAWFCRDRETVDRINGIANGLEHWAPPQVPPVVEGSVRIGDVLRRMGWVQ